MITPTHIRRYVMRQAWSAKRADPGASFADCLRRAWRSTKRKVAEALRCRRLSAEVQARRDAASTRRPEARAAFAAPLVTIRFGA